MMTETLNELITCYLPISLQEINDISLMKRIDTKFIVHKNKLAFILEKIKSTYKVLEIEKHRIMTYNSLYFDTQMKKFYYDHHNGRPNRTKIRIRNYVESNLYFLEIKQKDGRGKTNKTRIPILNFQTALLEKSIDFIKMTIKKDYQLIPSIWINFNRITLANSIDKERVTIDWNLTYKMNNLMKTYDNLAIIELKQEQFNRNSSMVKVLRDLCVHSQSVSKYCIGMLNLYKDLKYNTFKSKILKISRL